MSRRKFPEIADMEITADMINAAIDQWVVGDYAERNRNILKRYYIDGICVDGKQPKTLTSEFNLSPRQIRKIIDKHKIKIFKELGLM